MSSGTGQTLRNPPAGVKGAPDMSGCILRQRPPPLGDCLKTSRAYFPLLLHAAVYYRCSSTREVPIGWTPFAGVREAVDVFVGYLMFDAWIANTDRHHEN